MKKNLSLLLVSIFLSSCEFKGSFREKIEAWVKAPASDAGAVGQSNSQATPPPSASEVPLASPAGGAPALSRAEQAKRNSEILGEIHRVVFVEEATDASSFGNMVDSMNQGASLEGVYNGYVHSSAYKEKEKKSPVITPDGLKVFVEELVELEVELEAPTEFDLVEGELLPNRMKAPERPKQLDFDRAPSPSPGVGQENLKKALTEKYLGVFVGQSVFALKRILGDEALMVAANKRAAASQFASWYAKWVVRIHSRKIDFGLELRNRADEGFHFAWALKQDSDVVQWEILNRVHRILNPYHISRKHE